MYLSTKNVTLRKEANDTPEFAHYADAASVTEGYITGKPIVAICKKVFIPSRDPQKFQICPTCRELAEALFIGDIK